LIIKPKVLVAFNSNLFYEKFKVDLVGKMSKICDLHILLPKMVIYPNHVNIHCHYLPLERRTVRLFAELNLVLGYLRILFALKPHVIMSFTIKPNVYLGILSRILRIPIIQSISGLGSAYHDKLIPRPLFFLLHRIAFHKRSHVIVENNSIKDILSSAINFNNQVIVVNGSGVNTDHFSVTQYPEGGPTVFLFVGRILKEKGIFELLNAFVEVLKNGHYIRLSILGDIDNCGLDLSPFYDYQEIIFHGFHNDVRPFIAGCNALIQPSHHEGMSNVVLEASSMGRPIIASNIPGCREAIEDEKTGLLFDVGDTHDLILKMEQFLSFDRDRAKNMGLAARMKIKKDFTKDKIDQVYIDLLKGMFENYYGKKI